MVGEECLLTPRRKMNGAGGARISVSSRLVNGRGGNRCRSVDSDRVKGWASVLGPVPASAATAAASASTLPTVTDLSLVDRPTFDSRDWRRLVRISK